MGLYTCFEKNNQIRYTWYHVSKNDTQIGHGAKRQKSVQINLKPGSIEAEKFADSNDVYNSISPRMALEQLARHCDHPRAPAVAPATGPSHRASLWMYTMGFNRVAVERFFFNF